MLEAVSFEREDLTIVFILQWVLARMSYIVAETSFRMLEVLSFSSIGRGLNITSFNKSNRAKVSDEKKVNNEAFRGFLVLKNTRNLFIGKISTM